MADERSVGDVNQHVKKLPNRRSQIPGQKIVAGGGHQKENDEREQSELLKRKVRQPSEIPVRSEKADDRILVAQTVELDDGKNAVNSAQKERCHAQMTPIIEKRQKARVQPTERSDAQNDVKQQKRCGTCSANDQCFGSRKRKQQISQCDKNSQIRRYSREQKKIVYALLPIPSDCLVLVAHDLAPIGIEPST